MPKYAAKREGTRSAKCMFCGKRLGALWQSQARIAEENSAPTCYGCVLHAAIATNIQEESAKKEREEKERDRRREEGEEAELGREQVEARVITQQSPAGQAKRTDALRLLQEAGKDSTTTARKPRRKKQSNPDRPDKWREHKGGTMVTVVARLRERYGRIHFFADTGTYTGMQRMGIGSQGICRRFCSNRAENTPQAHYFCLIISPGHWTLAVIKVGGNKNNGWILNLLKDVDRSGHHTIFWFII